jgi:hypothetical protein
MKSAEWTVPQTGGGTILEFEQLASVPFLPFGTKFQGKHNRLSRAFASRHCYAAKRNSRTSSKICSWGRFLRELLPLPAFRIPPSRNHFPVPTKTS